MEWRERGSSVVVIYIWRMYNSEKVMAFGMLRSVMVIADVFIDVGGRDNPKKITRASNVRPRKRAVLYSISDFYCSIIS